MTAQSFVFTPLRAYVLIKTKHCHDVVSKYEIVNNPSLAVLNAIKPSLLYNIHKTSIRKEENQFKNSLFRFKPVSTVVASMFFIQECNLFFPIPKMNVILNIHHLLFQNQYFFTGQLLKFDGYNKNNNFIHRITVKFHCQFITNLLKLC